MSVVLAASLGSALIGRDTELSVLGQLTQDLTEGRGRSVLVAGEPGIGKSALLRAAMAAASDAGCEVFSGAGDELGQALPLLPFLDALRVREPSDHPRRTTIVRLLRGELAADRGTDVSAALAEQLIALLAEQCAARPTVLAIDDLQWADQASVALWGRLARSVRQLPLLLIGQMRPVPLRDDVVALRRAVGDAVRIELTGLPEDAVTELVTTLAGGQPDGRLLRLAGGAAGNPLYVTELVAALSRSSRLTVGETGAVRLRGGPVPSSLSAAIADRLGFVSGPVREVVQAAALLGVEFAVPDLATVLGRAVADLMPAVDSACAAGVLAESAGGLGFRHPLIRAALYDVIPEPVRAAWHRDAGRALAEAGAPAERVARQLARAVDGPHGSAGGAAGPMDEWMLGWLAGAADLLIGRAPQLAADLLRRAIDSSVTGSAGHDRLVGRLADALYRVGDLTGAEQVASSALAHAADPDLRVDLCWTLAQCSMKTGRSAESLATISRGLDDPGITVRHRGRLLVLAARTHSHLGEVEKAGRVATTALAAGSEAADSWAISWSLMVLAIVKAVQGQTAAALDLFDQALAAAQADASLTDLRLLLQINKAVTLGGLDRHTEALASARQARQLADQSGTMIRLAQARSALGQLLFETGSWDEALAEVGVVHVDLKEPAAACADLGLAALICFHRGEIATARGYLEAATPHAEQIGNRVIVPLALAQGLDSELRGELPAALTALTAGFDGDAEELDGAEDLLVDAVRLAASIGELGTAKTMAGHAETLAEGAQTPRRQATALYCGGVLENDAARLLASAEQFTLANRTLLSAKALEAAAEAFVDAGERGPARDAFTRAVEIYTGLGAAADVARLQARFRAHGIRRGPTAKHRQARSGWDSLTPTEQKVAALVEDGLSNPDIAGRLFLSRRTVGTHVSHILKKLDVHSRTEIAREAARRSAAAS